MLTIRQEKSHEHRNRRRQRMYDPPVQGPVRGVSLQGEDLPEDVERTEGHRRAGPSDPVHRHGFPQDDPSGAGREAERNPYRPVPFLLHGGPPRHSGGARGEGVNTSLTLKGETRLSCKEAQGINAWQRT